MNAGQVLEDAVYYLIRDRQDRFYSSVAENVIYKDVGVEGEIDVFAYHHIHNKKRYVIIVECKLSHRYKKTVSQLKRAREYILSKHKNTRVFCFYAHDYKAKTHKYKIEWLWKI